MKFVIQRVKKSSVKIDGKIVGKIGYGLNVLVGVEETDTKEIADKMVRKLVKLRIFDDENGKTNLDINKVNGELLLISQFTLCADMKKGNRPSFIKAARPEMSEPMYEYILEECKKHVDIVEKGEFGAKMEVEIINDGPFTIILDSNEL